MPVALTKARVSSDCDVKPGSSSLKATPYPLELNRYRHVSRYVPPIVLAEKFAASHTWMRYRSVSPVPSEPVIRSSAPAPVHDWARLGTSAASSSSIHVPAAGAPVVSAGPLAASTAPLNSSDQYRSAPVY